MTKEENELVIKDICGRLPYGLKMQVTLDLSYDTSYGSVEQNCGFVATLYAINIDGSPTDILIHHENNDTANYLNERFTDCPDILERFVPYLRPMESMTVKEGRELESLGWRVDELAGNAPWAHCGAIHHVADGIDFLNRHMFDYRGLILMGLAESAPDGMYNIQNID